MGRLVPPHHLVMLAHAYLAVIKLQATDQGCSLEGGAMLTWTKG